MRPRWLLVPGMILAASVLTSPASAAVEPELVLITANRTCADLLGADAFDHDLKVDPPANGTYEENGFSVTISNLTNSKTFDWSSENAVVAVYVKAGAIGSYLYVYDPPQTSDTGLTSPGTGNAISHISFCLSAAAAPTPTPTPTPEPTATPTATPSSEVGSTTQQASPTPAVEVLGIQVDRDPILPASGSNTRGLVSTAAMLLFGGAALLTLEARLRLQRSSR